MPKKQVSGREPPAGRGPSQVCRWDAASSISLAHLLKPPTCLCVESGIAVPEDLKVTGDAASLVLCVSTATAVNGNVALLFADALEQRLSICEDLALRLKTAVHEATVNAAIHGNLGLTSDMRDSLDGGALLLQRISQLLAQESLSSRRVTLLACWTDVSIRITVRDEGRGFSPASLPDRRERGFGRGLSIINLFASAVHIDNGGRDIVMEFRR